MNGDVNFLLRFRIVVCSGGSERSSSVRVGHTFKFWINMNGHLIQLLTSLFYFTVQANSSELHSVEPEHYIRHGQMLEPAG